MADPLLVQTLPQRLAGVLGDSRPPYYLHRTTPWIWTAMIALAMLAVVAALAFVAVQAARGTLDAAGVMVGIFVLPFLVLLLRPSAWRSPVSMVADSNGLHFLHGRAAGERHSVAWDDVGAMEIVRFAGGAGSARTVVVHIKGDSPFWAPTRSSRFMRYFVQSVEADGCRRLPLPPAWTDPDAALAALERLRARAGG